MKRVKGNFFIPDQALSSLSNALFAVIAVRAGPDAPVFAAWFILNNVVVQIVRQSVLETTLLSHGSDGASAGGRLPTTGRTSLVGGGILAIGVAGGILIAPLLALFALTSCAILFQDGLRYHSFAVDRAKSAFAGDLIWSCTAVAGATITILSGSVLIGFALWATGPFAGAAVCAFSFRTLRWDSPRAIRLSGRRSALFEVLVHQAQTPVLLGIIAFVGVPDDTTLLLVSRTVLGPAVIVVVGTQSALLVRWSQKEGQDVSIARTSMALTLFVGAYVATAAVAFVLVGKAIFSISFAAIAAVMLPLGVAYAMDATVGVARISLRAAGKSGTTARLRLLAAALQIGPMLLGASIDGTFGALTGLAGGSAVSAVTYVTIASRGSQTTSTSATV